MRKAVALLSLLVFFLLLVYACGTSSATGKTDDFCTVFRKVMRSAEKPGDRLTSLRSAEKSANPDYRESWMAKTIIPGFGATHINIDSAGNNYTAIYNLAESDTLETAYRQLVSRIAACLEGEWESSDQVIIANSIWNTTFKHNGDTEYLYPYMNITASTPGSKLQLFIGTPPTHQ
ncbi:MAG: hypothetical protein M3Q97_02410 [Bacteroidota bacterium]|nr:hypothetical protein [Bacteroidota bacterium]